MKNTKVLFSLALVAVFALSFVFVACNRNNELQPTTSENIKGKKRNANLPNYPQIHNNFMSYTRDNFVVNPSATTKEMAFNHIVSFLQTNTNGYTSMSQEEASNFNTGLVKHKELLDYRKTVSYVANQSTLQGISGNQVSLTTLVNELATNNVISIGERDELVSFQNTLNGVFTNQVSQAQYTTYLTNTASRTQQANYKIMPIVLSISLASNDWWVLNPGENDFVIKAFPLGLDAAGAIIGAVGNAGVQYAITGSVNGNLVIGSACVGAVVGSTGAVGKLAKWIDSWF